MAKRTRRRNKRYSHKRNSKKKRVSKKRRVSRRRVSKKTYKRKNMRGGSGGDIISNLLSSLSEDYKSRYDGSGSEIKSDIRSVLGSNNSEEVKKVLKEKLRMKSGHALKLLKLYSVAAPVAAVQDSAAAAVQDSAAAAVQDSATHSAARPALISPKNWSWYENIMDQMKTLCRVEPTGAGVDQNAFGQLMHQLYQHTLMLNIGQSFDTLSDDTKLQLLNNIFGMNFSWNVSPDREKMSFINAAGYNDQYFIKTFVIEPAQSWSSPYAPDYDLFTTEFEIYANCFAFNLDLTPEPRFFIICRTDYGEYICFYIADRYTTIEELSNSALEIEEACGALLLKIRNTPINHADGRPENYVFKNEGKKLKAYFIDWGFANTRPFDGYSDKINPPTENSYAYMVNIDRYYNWSILQERVNNRWIEKGGYYGFGTKVPIFEEFTRYYRYSPNLNRLQNRCGEDMINFAFIAIWDQRVDDFIRRMLENCIDSEHKLELLLTAWSIAWENGEDWMSILNVNKSGYIRYFSMLNSFSADDHNKRMLIKQITSCLEQHF